MTCNNPLVTLNHSRDPGRHASKPLRESVRLSAWKILAPRRLAATMQQERMDVVSLIEQAHGMPKGEHASERANGEEYMLLEKALLYGRVPIVWLVNHILSSPTSFHPACKFEKIVHTRERGSLLLPLGYIVCMAQ